MSTDDDRYMDIRELMEYSSLSDRTLRKVAKELNAKRTSDRGKYLVKKSEFDAWREQRNSPPTPPTNPQALELLKEVLTKGK